MSLIEAVAVLLAAIPLLFETCWFTYAVVVEKACVALYGLPGYYYARVFYDPCWMVL